MATSKSADKSILANKPASKAIYRDIKRRLLEWEQNNYSKLAIITDTNGMHKMFDHSAIIFSCQVAKKLGITDVALIDDSDFNVATDKPVCLLGQYNNIRRALLSAGMKEGVCENGVMVFDLGYTLSENDLIEMKKEQDTLIDRANKLVLPCNVHPRLRTELLRLTELVSEMVRKINPVYREVIGVRLAKTLVLANAEFISMANGNINASTYLKKLRTTLMNLNGELLTMVNLKMYDVEKLFRIIQQNNKTINKLAGAMEQARKRAKEGMLDAV